MVTKSRMPMKVSLLASVALFCVAGLAGAQDAASENRAAKEQLEFAERVVQDAENLSRNLLSQLNEAKGGEDGKGDVILAECLSTVLSQVNARLGPSDQEPEQLPQGSARRRLANLRQAVRTGDDQQRETEYAMFLAFAEDFKELRKEGRCLDSDEDAYEVGASRVVSVVDEGVPVENPSTLTVAPSVTVPLTPPPSSPSD